MRKRFVKPYSGRRFRSGKDREQQSILVLHRLGSSLCTERRPKRFLPMCPEYSYRLVRALVHHAARITSRRQPPRRWPGWVSPPPHPSADQNDEDGCPTPREIRRTIDRASRASIRRDSSTGWSIAATGLPA